MITFTTLYNGRDSPKSPPKKEIKTKTNKQDYGFKFQDG